MQRAGRDKLMKIDETGTKNGKGSWDDLWRRRKRIYVYANVLEAVREVGDLREARILEVGCGRGITLLELARSGAWVVGLDYSPEAIATCKRFEERMERPGGSVFLRGDAKQLPFAEGSFDFVYSIGLIEHFEDPGLLLAEQYRVLRPGGTLLVQVPQKYSLYTLVKKLLIWMGKWPYGGWETQFSGRELSELVVRVGFKPQLSYGYGSLTLAAVRHLAVPTLDFAKMWRVGMKWPWLRAAKARTALDLCLVARKIPHATTPQLSETPVPVLNALA